MASLDQSPSTSRQEKKLTTTRFYGAKYLQERSGTNVDSSPQEIYHTQQGSVINPRKYFREVYGPFLCSLLVISSLLVIAGGALTLAGYYVPRLSVDQLLADKINHIEAIRKVEQHNETLSGLRICGIVLLAVGAIGLTVLFLTPVVCLRRTEYTLLPSTDDTKGSFSSTPSGLPEDMFTFSVVKQHIQPRKQTKASRTAQHRANYDKGFLSPELNRGPIFVSDENFKIQDNGRNRNRSSSFDARLSPQSPRRQMRATSRYSVSDSLTPEMKRSVPVKTGSFHSLR